MARSKKSDWGMDSGLGSMHTPPQRLIRVKGHIVICVVSISVFALFAFGFRMTIIHIHQAPLLLVE
jgi:hypothetical protein